MNGLLLTKCLRCSGAMAYEKIYSSHGEYWGWKCLICGEIVDPVILNNRQSMIAGQEIAVRRVKRCSIEPGGRILSSNRTPKNIMVRSKRV